MRDHHVVIEYVFEGQSGPDELEALEVEAKVVGNYGAPPSVSGTQILADVRAELQSEGFELHEIRLTKPRTHGRWQPTWAEVWTREAPASTYSVNGFGDLSPRAAKARQEAAARARGYWPRLARTADKAIVLRPLDGRRGLQRRFAQGLAEVLPDFKFNSTCNWWEAPLSELETAHEALSPEVHLSDGVREYLGMEA